MTLVDELSARARRRGVACDGSSSTAIDVTDRLHAPEVDRAVSAVSRQPAVRARAPRAPASPRGPGRIIVAGRDIGSVVLPDADLKLYLDVSLEERARRRAAERGLAAEAAEAARSSTTCERRDLADSTREVAPLRVPEGALVIRSDGKSFAETVAAVVSGGPRGRRAGTRADERPFPPAALSPPRRGARAARPARARARPRRGPRARADRAARSSSSPTT